MTAPGDRWSLARKLGRQVNGHCVVVGDLQWGEAIVVERHFVHGALEFEAILPPLPEPELREPMLTEL